MPSTMSPPSTALFTPGSPISPDLNDDSNLESEILDAICKKTLLDVDLLARSMKACISECYSTLNQRFFWFTGSEMLFGSDLHQIVPDSEDPDSILEGSLPYSLGPASVLEVEQSIVPETEFDDLKDPLLQSQDSKKRKIYGGGYGGATSEPAPLKAMEMDPCKEIMLFLFPCYASILDESIVPETEFEVEESIVPETEFEVEELIVAETEFDELKDSLLQSHSKKRKIYGGGYGGAPSEPAPLKMDPCEKIMLLLLPSHHY